VRAGWGEFDQDSGGLAEGMVDNLQSTRSYDEEHISRCCCVIVEGCDGSPGPCFRLQCGRSFSRTSPRLCTTRAQDPGIFLFYPEGILIRKTLRTVRWPFAQQGHCNRTSGGMRWAKRHIQQQKQQKVFFLKHPAKAR
jgi:hypothetical protein